MWTHFSGYNKQLLGGKSLATSVEGFKCFDAQIKTNVPSVMSFTQRIGGEGFEDVQVEDVAEILTQFVIKLTNEEFNAGKGRP